MLCLLMLWVPQRAIGIQRAQFGKLHWLLSLPVTSPQSATNQSSFWSGARVFNLHALLALSACRILVQAQTSRCCITCLEVTRMAGIAYRTVCGRRRPGNSRLGAAVQQQLLLTQMHLHVGTAWFRSVGFEYTARTPATTRWIT